MSSRAKVVAMRRFMGTKETGTSGILVCGRWQGCARVRAADSHSISCSASESGSTLCAASRPINLSIVALRGSRRARSGLTGLGCWSDAFRLHPHFVPAGPRDVKSLKHHRIFHHFSDRPKVGMICDTPPHRPRWAFARASKPLHKLAPRQPLWPHDGKVAALAALLFSPLPIYCWVPVNECDWVL